MPALFDRSSALPGLTITSSIAYTLLGLQLNGYRGSESALLWTRNHRTAVTVLVQLLSQVLGIIHVHVICALIRSSFLERIANKPFQVSTAHFIQTFATPRWTWGLSLEHTIALLVMLAAAVVPAPLWAAAIAPLPAQTHLMRMIDIPTLNTSNVATLWDSDTTRAAFGRNGSNEWMIDQGVFSYSTQLFRVALLPTAREASLVVDGAYRHNKLDKTGFTYVGRSYGAGAAAGFPDFPYTVTPEWYQYEEVGIHAIVSCFYNKTGVKYNFSRINAANSPLGLWQSSGFLANGKLGGFITYAAWTKYDLFAWANVYDNKSRKGYVQLFTGANSTYDPYAFVQLQNIQCNPSFEPRTAIVGVNNTGKLIHTEVVNGANHTWPIYGDSLMDKVSSDLGWLTFSDSCIISGCVLGTSLVFNINTLKKQNSDNSSAAVLKGTEEFIASMVDNILINRVLTRYALNAPDSTMKVPATVVIPSIVFGDRKFIIIVAVLNGIIVVTYLGEFARTQAWRATPPFDIMDDSKVMIAAFEGGRAFERSEKPASLRDSANGRQISKTTVLSLHLGIFPLVQKEQSVYSTNESLHDNFPLVGRPSHGVYPPSSENSPSLHRPRNGLKTPSHEQSTLRAAADLSMYEEG